ncbi:MAG TPA: TonB-dependent receptor, partial [Blastocatellia bacterium]|nr:TonB-dependent receptor [Blastocatellia bacterium]
WTHGAHTMKVGFNISHFPYYSLFTQIHQGEYLYSSPEPPGATGPVGPASQFQIGLGPAQVNAADNIYGFYAQDTWKFKPNLTLNYGLRYDVESGAFQGGTVKANVPGGCVQANGLIPACSSDHNNFQPRIGIAWSPNFRTGFLHTLFGDPDRTVISASFAEITELAYLNVVLDSLNFDGVNLLTVNSTDPNVLKFAPGLPPQSVLNSLIPAGFFGRVRPISNDLRNPETRHINLTVTRQIGKSMVVDATYLGVFGFGLFGENDTNYPQILPDPAHPGFFYFGNRPDSQFTAVRTNQNSRTSSYQGFLLHLTKRLSHHFEVQGSYAFSKLLASTEDFFGVSEPGDPNNIAADRALAQSNPRHQATFSFIADTANATTRPVVKYFVNNWTLGFIGQLQSGRPYPVSSGDAPFAGEAFFGIGNETQQRPNLMPDGSLSVTNIANGQFGTNLLVGPGGAAACHCPQTTFLAPAGASTSGPVDSILATMTNGTLVPVDFQFINGDLVRNAGNSSPYYRFDVSFIKAFRVVPSNEQMRLEFKVDVFNIFNRPNFLLNNTNDDLNILPLGIDRTTGLAISNCTSCLNPVTGKFIGSDGRVLTINQLQSGRVSKDLQTPIFAGIGDPAQTDLARTIQLSIRFRW